MGWGGGGVNDVRCYIHANKDDVLRWMMYLFGRGVGGGVGSL